MKHNENDNSHTPPGDGSLSPDSTKFGINSWAKQAKQLFNKHKNLQIPSTANKGITLKTNVLLDLQLDTLFPDSSEGDYNPDSVPKQAANMTVEDVEQAERRGLRPGNLVRLHRAQPDDIVLPQTPPSFKVLPKTPLDLKKPLRAATIVDKAQQAGAGKILMYLGCIDGTLGTNPGYPIKVQRWLWKDKVITVNLHPSIFSIIGTRTSTPKPDPSDT